MNEPSTTPTLGNLFHELSSASSALHTPPEPKLNPHPEAMFLDELNLSAAHAQEHIRACNAVARGIGEKVVAMKALFFKWSKVEESEKEFILEQISDLIYSI